MEMKNYHFGVKLQSRELNLVLRKTAMIVREVPLGLGQFRKSPDFFEYSPDFKASFSRNHARKIKYYLFYIDENSVTQGNEKVAFSSRVTKP